MKTLRIILGALAILGASGATLATQHHSSDMETYIFLPAQGSDPAVCKRVEIDCSGNGALCTYEGFEVRDANNVNAQCGKQLHFNSPQ